LVKRTGCRGWWPGWHAGGGGHR